MSSKWVPWVVVVVIIAAWWWWSQKKKLSGATAALASSAGPTNLIVLQGPSTAGTVLPSIPPGTVNAMPVPADTAQTLALKGYQVTASPAGAPLVTTGKSYVLLKGVM